MDQNKALDLAVFYAISWGVPTSWEINLIDSFPPLGECVVTVSKELVMRKFIHISRPYVLVNDEAEVTETILHEIAHALDYEQTGDIGHTANWRRICREIGCKPEATARHSSYRVPITGHGLQCENEGCGYGDFSFMRKPRKKRQCPDCGSNLNPVHIP